MKKIYYLAVLLLFTCLSSCGSEKRESDTNVNVPRFSGYFTITDIDETPINQKGITFNIENQKRRITGFAGCNSYNAAFTLGQDKLDITAPLSTKRMCPPEQMVVEKRVLKTLPQVTRYTLQNGKLVLYNKEIIVLRAIYTDL